MFLSAAQSLTPASSRQENPFDRVRGGTQGCKLNRYRGCQDDKGARFSNFSIPCFYIEILPLRLVPSSSSQLLVVSYGKFSRAGVFPHFFSLSFAFRRRSFSIFSSSYRCCLCWRFSAFVSSHCRGTKWLGTANGVNASTLWHAIKIFSYFILFRHRSYFPPRNIPTRVFSSYLHLSPSLHKRSHLPWFLHLGSSCHKG